MKIKFTPRARARVSRRNGERFNCHKRKKKKKEKKRKRKKKNGRKRRKKEKVPARLVMGDDKAAVN